MYTVLVGTTKSLRIILHLHSQGGQLLAVQKYNLSAFERMKMPVCLTARKKEEGGIQNVRSTRTCQTKHQDHVIDDIISSL